MDPHHQLTESQITSIISAYRPGVRGCGARTISHNTGIPYRSCQNVIDRYRTTGSGKQRQRGRKRTLTPEQERRVCQRVDDDPSLSNRKLSRVTRPPLTPRTFSNILHRASPPFTRKKPIDREPEEYTDEWKAKVTRFRDEVLEHIPMRMRVYADEAAIYENEASSWVRSRKGKKVYRPRSHWAKKYTLHVYVKQFRVLHWELSRLNANDNEIVRVMKQVAPLLEEGDVLLWDQLGRSGRCLHPSKQHFSEEVRDMVERRWCSVVHLPPKGKYFDPVELLFNDLKGLIRRQNKKWTFDTLKSEIAKYMEEQAPSKLPGFFRERANGRCLEDMGVLQK